MTELLPCPFCGNKAEADEGEEYGYVECVDYDYVCSAQIVKRTKEAALAAWEATK